MIQSTISNLEEICRQGRHLGGINDQGHLPVDPLFSLDQSIDRDGGQVMLASYENVRQYNTPVDLQDVKAAFQETARIQSMAEMGHIAIVIRLPNSQNGCNRQN